MTRCPVTGYSPRRVHTWQWDKRDVKHLTFGDWPGRIVAGAGATSRLAEVMDSLGASRAMVICGATVKRTAMLGKVEAGLGPRLASLFAEARPHTPVEMVERGLAQFHDTRCDALVTVGGGSAIDAGKAIAVMLATGGDLAAYEISYRPGGEKQHKPIRGKPPVHIAVSTTAGSASDVMPTAGCRDPKTRRKMLFWDDVLTPDAAILDPEMAIYMSLELTAATGMTAMARAIESLYSANRHPISTGLALHAVRLLRTGLPASLADPGDIEARAACQMASTMSGMAAINAMVSVVHAIGHVVGGRYGLQHGTSHTILLPAAMRLLMPTMGGDQRLVLDALGAAASGTSGSAAADAAAEAMWAFVRKLPMPARLRDVKVGEAELPEIAHLTMSDYMMANLPRPMPEAEVLSLLREAW